MPLIALRYFMRFQRNVFEHTLQETLRERAEAVAAAEVLDVIKV